MISERSKREWMVWKDRLNTALAEQTVARQNEDSSALFAMQDTVGAVCCDCTASLTAGVSRQAAWCLLIRL